MIFEYGEAGHYVDVTDLVEIHFSNEEEYFIPSADDRRAKIFGDHLLGTPKKIKVTDGETVGYYDNEEPILIKRNLPLCKFSPKQILSEIHSRIICHGGSITEEYPEQLLTSVFIKPTDKVLELGANIGRNTLLISSILEDSSNLVTLETMPSIAKTLELNKKSNNFNFHIENSAISTYKVIQSGWDSFVLEEGMGTPTGFVEINTITFPQILEKYQINFNVLVADCEGALFYILNQEPNFLANIETIIVENDYDSTAKKENIDEVYRKNGFVCVLKRPLNFRGEIRNDFYAVWRKNYFFEF